MSEGLSLTTSSRSVETMISSRETLTITGWDVLICPSTANALAMATIRNSCTWYQFDLGHGRLVRVSGDTPGEGNALSEEITAIYRLFL